MARPPGSKDGPDVIRPMVIRRQDGGARPGSGRPKKDPNEPKTTYRAKLNSKEILKSIFASTGKPFEVNLAEGYANSIINGDDVLRYRYEQIILSKVVADKVEMDVSTLGESINDRRQSFQTLLASMRDVVDVDTKTTPALLKSNLDNLAPLNDLPTLKQELDEQISNETPAIPPPSLTPDQLLDLGNRIHNNKDK